MLHHHTSYPVTYQVTIEFWDEKWNSNERAQRHVEWTNERTKERNFIFSHLLFAKSRIWLFLRRYLRTPEEEQLHLNHAVQLCFLFFYFNLNVTILFFYLNFTEHFLNWRNDLKYIKTIKELEQNFGHIFLAVCQLNNWQIIKGFSGWRVPWSGLSCGV